MCTQWEVVLAKSLDCSWKSMLLQWLLPKIKKKKNRSLWALQGRQGWCKFKAERCLSPPVLTARNLLWTHVPNCSEVPWGGLCASSDSEHLGTKTTQGGFNIPDIQVVLCGLLGTVCFDRCFCCVLAVRHSQKKRGSIFSYCTKLCTWICHQVIGWCLTCTLTFFMQNNKLLIYHSRCFLLHCNLHHKA